MDGYFLIDKTKGWTSFDVVAKVRSELKKLGIQKPKVGHCGTLDPLATGLLIIVVGSFTKKAQDFTKMDKSYEATIQLGFTSSTDDEEGEKLPVSSRQPSEKEVVLALQDFEGAITQVPPAYSAIKVGGKRAYKEARKGKEVTLEPRAVTIHAIENVEYKYPVLQFNVSVSSGTYIRSLARDMGNVLKTGAYLHELRRTSIGSYTIDHAITMAQLNDQNIASLIKQ